VVVLWTAVVGMLIAVAGLWYSREPLGSRVGIAGLLVILAGFILWVLYSTDYTLTRHELIIRSGPFRWTIPLNSIEEVFPTHNPLSSPACSLDRLHIRYRGSRGGIMISPRDKTAFLQDLTAREPGLRREGNSVWRAQR
jgi:hypothetical protein